MLAERHRAAGGGSDPLEWATPDEAELMNVRCRSVEEMRLVNLPCHREQYTEAGN